jgi:arylsulfatase A-like enzyme
VPLIVAGPGFTPGTRSRELATTLDLVPTILDAVKVSYPPGLSGKSLLPVVGGRSLGRARLPGQNDRNHVGLWDERFKIVGTPAGEGRDLALYDRETDPGETENAGGRLPDRMAEERQRLEGLLEEIEAESARTRRLLEGRSGEERLSAEACEQLKAMGYIQDACP